jgi:hypothetical protein
MKEHIDNKLSVREAFEAWIKKNYFNSFEALTKKDDGNYWNFEAREKWEIWQAAIDSTEAKLASREDKLSAVPANHIADADKMVEPLRDAIASCLTSVYICNRVWSAWSYGTMSQDDFIEARETEFLDDLVGVVMSVMQSQAQQPAYEDHDTAKHHEWLKKVETENAGKANELICDMPAQEPLPQKVMWAFENIRNNYEAWQDNPNFKVLEQYLLKHGEFSSKQPAQEPVSEAVPWTYGANEFKDWCSHWFGVDADESYLSKAIYDLPPMAQNFNRSIFQEPVSSNEHVKQESKLQRRIDRLVKRLEDYKLKYEGKEKQLTFHAGYDMGYVEGQLSILEELPLPPVVRKNDEPVKEVTE